MDVEQRWADEAEGRSCEFCGDPPVAFVVARYRWNYTSYSGLPGVSSLGSPLCWSCLCDHRRTRWLGAYRYHVVRWLTTRVLAPEAARG